MLQEGWQPTWCNSVMWNLNERRYYYNTKGLVPKEKQLNLIYLQQTVSIQFFDASEVFASLLSCPTLFKDENHSFLDDANVGDIITGCCDSMAHDALIMDWYWYACTLHFGNGQDWHWYGWLAPDGTNNTFASAFELMCILVGYTANRSTPPLYLPSPSEQDTKVNAPAGLS